MKCINCNANLIEGTVFGILGFIFFNDDLIITCKLI
jgi:hypothetical protein